MILGHLLSQREKLHMFTSKEFQIDMIFFSCEIMSIIIFNFHNFDIQNIPLILNFMFYMFLTKKIEAKYHKR